MRAPGGLRGLFYFSASLLHLFFNMHLDRIPVFKEQLVTPIKHLLVLMTLLQLQILVP